MTIAVVRDARGRAQHRRRLRGPARPRLRRLLRARRLHGRLVRLRPVPAGRIPFRLGRGSADDARGIHISIWLVLLIAGDRRRSRGIIIGLADPAAARRLPRDRHARLRRDRPPGRPQRATTSHGFDLTHGIFGINPIDSPGFGDSSTTPSAYPTRTSIIRPPTGSSTGRCSCSLLVTDLLLRPAARLAARPGLGRDSRGRDRGRRDGHPADAHEDLGLRDRRLLRRSRGRVLSRASRPSPSRASSTSTSRSSCSAWSSSAAWAASGASSSRRVILSWLNVEGLANIGSWLNEQHAGLELRGRQVPVRDLRRHPGPDDAVPTRGADTRAPAQARARRGRRWTSRSTDARQTQRARPERMTASAEPLLDAQEVRKEFGGLVAVERRRLHDPERAIVSLIGPNGAGKTTFFNMLTGVYKPTSGRDRLRRRGRHRQAAARDREARASAGRSRTSASSRR